MRIAIIGSGHVGLVSRACLAGFGHTVVCTDKDVGRIDVPSKVNGWFSPFCQSGCKVSRMRSPRTLKRITAFRRRTPTPTSKRARASARRHGA